MHYVLQGKIAKAHPYQLDKTLTLEGAGAEAQAVGKAIEEVKKHSELKNNPHNLTAKQIGLGNVDNTSDMDKPVSTAQRAAIDVVQAAVEYAQQAADNGCVSASKAQDKAVIAREKAENAQSTADNAQTAAVNAQVRADNAYDLANSKSSVNAVMLGLDKSKWSDNTQEVTVEGLNVTDVVFLWPHHLDSEEYFRCGVYGSLQGNESITFKCAEVPTGNLSVHCAYITLGGT